jgi:uncharacterized protein (DUF58 family)
MTHVSPPRIVILVDTFVAVRDIAHHTAVERSIAMAASLASHGLEQGLCIGLVCWTEDGWAKIAAARGKRHRRDVLAVLARLPLNTTHDSTALLGAALELQDSASTMVMFSPADIGPGQRSNGALIVVSSEGIQSRRWFRFSPNVSFEHCMPADQEPQSKDEG